MRDPETIAKLDKLLQKMGMTEKDTARALSSGSSRTLAGVEARVEQTAEPGHVFVSSTVRDLLLGSEHHFAERGEFTLKGFDGPWRLYALKM